MNKRRDLKISNLRGQVREHEKLRDNSAAPCEHEDLTPFGLPTKSTKSAPVKKHRLFEIPSWLAEGSFMQDLLFPDLLSEKYRNKCSPLKSGKRAQKLHAISQPIATL